MEDRDERRYYPAPDFPGKLQQKKMNVGFFVEDGSCDFLYRMEDLGVTPGPPRYPGPTFTHFCACLCVKMTQEMKDLYLRRTEP